MPQRVLALELDGQELKAAVIETSFREYRVTGLYREPLAAGALAEQVRGFVQRHQLEGTTVLSSLPGDLVTLRTFFLPFRDHKRLEQTVPFELEAQVPFGLDDVVVDYSVLHRDRAGCSVLAALVQRRDLEQHLALLAEAGIDPKVVDLAPLAALNVLQLLGDDRPGTCAYVGGSLRQMTVALYRNRQLVGLRTLVQSAAAIDAAAGGNSHPVAAPPCSAAAREIRWTLLALNGAPLDSQLPCVVAGEGEEFDRLAQELATTLDLAVRRLDQVALRNLPAALHAAVAGCASPLGLALREVAPNNSLGLNFRRGEFAYHRGQEEMHRALWRSGVLAAVVVVLAMASTYMSYQQLAGRAALVQAQIRNVFTQTLPDVHHVTDEAQQLQGEIDAAQKRLQALTGVAPVGGLTAIDVLHTITTAIPDSIKTDIDEYVMDTDSVRLKVKADSFETADAIKQQLLNTHYFADVQVKDVKSTPDGKVDFRLVLTLNKYGHDAAPESAPPA